MTNYYYHWLQQWWQCMSTNWTSAEISCSCTSLRNCTLMNGYAALDHNHGHMNMFYHCSTLFYRHNACKQYTLEMVTIDITCVSGHRRYKGVESQKWKTPTRHLHYACAYVFQEWDASAKAVIRNLFLYKCIRSFGVSMLH